MGTDYINQILDDPVEVTEKIDGSQFDFGKVRGQLFMRSKGAELFFESYEKMFTEAVNYVKKIEKLIPNNTVYFCEYLKNPRHNILTYSRVPKNNLILFGVGLGHDKFIKDYDVLCKYAEDIDIEAVPLLFSGNIKKLEDILQFLETDSCLGGAKIEGMVVKNYLKPFLLGNQPIPIMMGKYVSEKFKEVHRKSWNRENTTGGKWNEFKESYRTEARWNKAIQHLKDKGELENQPKDIGKLIEEIQRDIEIEEKKIITEWLWQEFGREVLRKSVCGFPEYYKRCLLKRTKAAKDII